MEQSVYGYRESAVWSSRRAAISFGLSGVQVSGSVYKLRNVHSSCSTPQNPRILNARNPEERGYPPQTRNYVVWMLYDRRTYRVAVSFGLCHVAPS